MWVMEMSSKKQQIPAIRFNGFTDAWEQRKLKDVAPLQRGFDLPKSKINEGPYPVLFSNGIGGWNSEYKAKAPGVVTGRSGSIGNVVFVEQNYWPHNTSLWVTSFFDNYPRYVYYLYQHVDLSKFGTGSGVPTLNRNDVHDYSVIIPKPDEQTCIANFFKQLDFTIALHQRQLDNYKDLKKAMMQKIFNQELCFKDEEGNEYPEWEEKKVSDLFSITRGVVISKPSISEYKSSETPYPVFSSQTSNFGILGWSSEYDFEGLYLTWTTDGAGAGKVFSRTGKFRCTNVCGVLVGKIESYSNSCIKELLEKETPKHVSYVGNPKLMNNVMGQIKITVPSLKEQLAISGLFELFDRKILFQENLIEKLREQKEALMQQMFI
jgi:type I restriction enzyme S subunit